jgi:23S rRNA U2552 (ribose-2'-O)-methylase RlmE/FtsJ
MICKDEKLPLIVAIDLQPMAPIEGVVRVQDDVTNARTAEVVCTTVIPLNFVSSRCPFSPFRISLLSQ